MDGVKCRLSDQSTIGNRNVMPTIKRRRNCIESGVCLHVLAFALGIDVKAFRKDDGNVPVKCLKLLDGFLQKRRLPQIILVQER